MSSGNGSQPPWEGQSPSAPRIGTNNSILNADHCDSGDSYGQVKTLQSIDSIVQFADGEKEKWNNVDIPIPKGMVIISTDTLDVKIGNGEDLYKDLPVLFSFQTIQDLVDKVNELADQISIKNKSVDYGDVTNNTFQFSLKDGYAHKVRVMVNNLTILEPILPENADSGDSLCIVTCGTTDTLITFGANMVFIGQDGRILLNGQSYIYTFKTVDGITYVESRLIPDVIA